MAFIYFLFTCLFNNTFPNFSLMAWNVSAVQHNELEKALQYYFSNSAYVPECKFSNVTLEKCGKVT
jgi:hypothetical protein